MCLNVSFASDSSCSGSKALLFTDLSNASRIGPSPHYAVKEVNLGWERFRDWRSSMSAFPSFTFITIIPCFWGRNSDLVVTDIECWVFT